MRRWPRLQRPRPWRTPAFSPSGGSFSTWLASPSAKVVLIASPRDTCASLTLLPPAFLPGESPIDSGVRKTGPVSRFSPAAPLRGPAGTCASCPCSVSRRFFPRGTSFSFTPAAPRPCASSPERDCSSAASPRRRRLRFSRVSPFSRRAGAGLLAGPPELFFLAPPEPELLPRPRPAARAGAFLTDDPLVFEI